MPKRVDHEQRRRVIAAALIRVMARDGVDAVSLRRVAAEAGVTAGMVQHYFPSKDTMMSFAMTAAAERYEQRMTDSVVSLGEDPEPAAVIRALLSGLLPADADQRDDARVSLAFQSYAATRGDASTELREANAQLTSYIATLIESVAKVADGRAAATALLATAEGLSLHVLSSALPLGDAAAALDEAIAALTSSAD